MSLLGRLSTPAGGRMAYVSTAIRLSADERNVLEKNARVDR
jgi:hypothetical protein